MTIHIDKEKEEQEDSGGLDHRGQRQHTKKVESEHVDTPPQVQDGEEDLDVDAVPEERQFKKVFKRTKTQGVGTPQPVRRSPRLSPQKEVLEKKRRRKLKLDKEVEESEESASGTPVQPEDMEEPVGAQFGLTPFSLKKSSICGLCRIFYLPVLMRESSFLYLVTMISPFLWLRITLSPNIVFHSYIHEKEFVIWA